VKNFNIREFISSENNSIATLGQNYRLSESSYAIVQNLNRIHDLIEALVVGAETHRVNFENDVPVGANVVLNQDFKDREIDLQLIEMEENSGAGIMVSLGEIGKNLESIMESHLKNSGASIARDKRASIKRSNALIKQLKNAFDLKIFDDIFANVPELEELSVPSNADNETLSIIATQVRTQLRNFEALFSKAFNELDRTSKEKFIQNIKKIYNPDLNDTSAIQNDEDKINVADSDFYWYLCSCTAASPNNFDAAYLALVKESSKLCPFDSQEEVVLQAARMLSLSSDDLDP
jgi:hypothetical protein